MKLEDQIKALAELDGLEVRLEYGPNLTGALFNEQEIWTIHRHKDIPHDWVIWKPKLYHESHDAIIPLVQKQDWKIKCEVTIQLRIAKQKTLVMVPTMDNLEGWCAVMLCTTPAQLCEALLRACGKWTE